MLANTPILPCTSVPNPTNGTLVDMSWRDPDITEVLNFLSSADPSIRANSVAYLQHITFMNDDAKKQVRTLGGIPILVDLLCRDVVEVQRNICGALRNLSYGRKNDENKRSIRDARGVQALVQTLVNNPDNEMRELSTSVLWNLSSCEDVKWSILDEALNAIVNVIIVPYTSWLKVNVENDSQILPFAAETHWFTVFRNATGILRNISSAGANARKQLRDCEGLIESILFLVKSSLDKNDIDNKLIENCICILRNLSFRCQETQDPDYDKNFCNGSSRASSTNCSLQNNKSSTQSTSTSLTSSLKPLASRMKTNFSCLRYTRKFKSKSSLNSSRNTTSSDNSVLDHRSAALLPPHHRSNLTTDGSTSNVVRTSTQVNLTSSATLPRSNISEIPKPTAGKELLWQSEIVKLYLAILQGTSNNETKEAAAGAIQNLAACFWQPSVDIRATVRKEKGLPILVELLRAEADSVVCAAATALRNLTIDQKNKELIGKYAIPDLVSKLPNGQPDHDNVSCEGTVAAVLATLHQVISSNADFAKSFYEFGGLNRLSYIVKAKQKFSTRVLRFNAQVLLDMWSYTEMRDVYKKGGWKESHFIVRTQPTTRNSTYSVNSNTIERPMTSQQADRSGSMKNLKFISAPTLQNSTIIDNNLLDLRNQSNYGIVPMTNMNGLLVDPPTIHT